MPPHKKPVAATAADPALEAPAATPVAAPPSPPAKPRHRAPGAAAPADPPVSAAAAAPGDPLTTEVPWMEPAADLPPFLRNRAPRPTPPVVRIIGEELCARPMPAPVGARPGSPPVPVPPPPPATPPSAATPDGPYAVYVLGDPDGTIHYVGISDNVPRRLAQHLNAAYNPRSRWLQALLDVGEQPRHKVVETVPTRAAVLAAERKWIGYYRRAGHPLTNGLLPPEPRSADANPGGSAPPLAPPRRLPRPSRQQAHRRCPRAACFPAPG